MSQRETAIGPQMDLKVTTSTERDLFTVDSGQQFVKWAKTRIDGLDVFDVMHLNTFEAVTIRTALPHGIHRGDISVRYCQRVPWGFTS